ncbi:helix-turn-helix transcriptional regulator [uncultured Microbacterium sp.]|uniref:helix-turn-helix domain-containing protein n=1 Tax=uncultured Microbacterium sp. TaxID=191216 RepID=UPI0026316847|nr:helix-turn-helix transcriptional regulator [uncultured Microbacterium sp.]
MSSIASSTHAVDVGMDRAPIRALLRDHLRMSRIPHPAGVTSAGRAAITLHAVDHGDLWLWSEAGDTGYIGIVFPVDEARAIVEGETPREGVDRTPVVLRHGYPMRLVWSRGAAATLWLPRAAVEDLGLDVERVPSRPSVTTAALAARAYVTTVAGMRPALSMVEAMVMERTLFDIAFALFFSAGEREVVAAARTSTFNRVRLLFESRFTDPRFSVAAAAAELHVSSRHLHRLFEKRGTSPSTYLRSLRVDFARALLEVRADSGMTVQGIARQSGFASERTMRRALAETTAASA